MMRRLFILIFMLLCSAESSRAQSRLHDSLLSRLEALPHNTERLKTLQALEKISQDDSQRFQKYNDMLLAESQQQQNSRYTCEAYLSRIISAYNRYDQNTLLEVLDLLEPLARKEKHYDLWFRAWRCKIDMMILTQDFERHERESLRMLEEARALDNQIGILEAYQCLGTVYRTTFRWKEAVDILEKARAMALDTNQSCDMVINIWLPLLYVYEDAARDNGNITDWFRSIQMLESYLLSIPKFASREDPVFLVLYASAIQYFLRVDDLKSASLYCVRGEKLLPQIKSPLYRILFNNSGIDYYNAMNQQEKRLEMIRENVRLFAEIYPGGVDYYNQLQREGALLYDLGRSQEALPIYKSVYEFKDSLQIATINKQYEQLKHDFNAEQLLLDRERIRTQMYLWITVLLLAGLLVISYFIIYLLRSRRFLTKAEGEMREMTRQVEQANEAKDRFLSNISSSIRIPLNEVVEGSLRLTTTGFTDPEARQTLSTRIRAKSAGLLSMINDILDLSRLEVGMMKFEVTDVELLSLLLDALAISDATKLGTEIHTDFPDNTLFMMRADSSRMQQVFRTLFVRDYAADAGAIGVILREENKTLSIRVTGCILAQNNQEQEVIIRNEINRMLIDHFGGSYQILHQQQPVVEIILPLSEVLVI